MTYFFDLFLRILNSSILRNTKGFMNKSRISKTYSLVFNGPRTQRGAAAVRGGLRAGRWGRRGRRQQWQPSATS